MAEEMDEASDACPRSAPRRLRPYDADDPDLVHYRDHFSATAGLRTDRAYGRVSNDDMPTALFVEFGTKNNPRHRTLGNALDAAGD
jgi:hypothetical protein